MTRNGEPRSRAQGRPLRGLGARPIRGQLAMSDLAPDEFIPLTLDRLVPAENLLGLLASIANVLRSDGVNDERTRYQETVKLLLARYCDEWDAAVTPSRVLKLQEYPGGDPGFLERVRGVYKGAARHYRRAKSLFSPRALPGLDERTLRLIVRLIQGYRLTSASNETMQQVFQSFAPALFKRSLDQYFTPNTLSEAMVGMAGVGPGDKVADPAMGTADLLTAALGQCGSDVAPRVFGIDVDSQARELAVVNMILNRDGDSTLLSGDSIAQHALWAGAMDVVVCNPPFGARSLERRAPVLAQYDLGYRWVQDAPAAPWVRTDEVRSDQQLGILFIERAWKMLAENGRLAIILPEGYLCTPSYGYVRQWIVDHMQVLSLIELPRRVFVKSDADLRSNILVARRVDPERLARLKAQNYPIYAALVRKVGFTMGARGSVPTVQRDPLTGAEIRDAANRPVRDDDFERVRDDFRKFHERCASPLENSWIGARFCDVAGHASLDMKPRRLMPKALANSRRIVAQGGFRLEQVADVVSETIDILENGGPSHPRRLVEGLNIRAVEGTVHPQPAAPSWQIAGRKSRLVYRLRDRDIIVGLVRPERRNIGLLLDGGPDLVGSVDGLAVVRVKPSAAKRYPQEWLFAALRSEACRLQLWTESGGTSYGKLTLDHIRNILIPVWTRREVAATARTVTAWAAAVQEAARLWQQVGTAEDRVPIVNSSPLGLAPDGTGDDD
ncbi:MAG: N-6 DNA methylase [Isosphaeraceae bacterium]|nr:N-6 DNA methylase [Isosphaeraceae bacterium]